MAVLSRNNPYIYLGNDVAVHGDDIIGIFDIERTTVNKDVNEFLRRSQKNGGIYYVSLDLPKSFIVSKDAVYVTNVSCATVKKRSRNGRKYS